MEVWVVRDLRSAPHQPLRLTAPEPGAMVAGKDLVYSKNLPCHVASLELN